MAIMYNPDAVLMASVFYDHNYYLITRKETLCEQQRMIGWPAYDGYDEERRIAFLSFVAYGPLAMISVLGIGDVTSVWLFSNCQSNAE